MTIYIEPEYVTRLEDENNRLIEKNNRLNEQRDNMMTNIRNLQRKKWNLIDENTQLKQELFNAYLEIESDNVNIQLSHYHIKKLLKIIDEHTLINPYTN